MKVEQRLQFTVDNFPSCKLHCQIGFGGCVRGFGHAGNVRQVGGFGQTHRKVGGFSGRALLGAAEVGGGEITSSMIAPRQGLELVGLLLFADDFVHCHGISPGPTCKV